MKILHNVFFLATDHNVAKAYIYKSYLSGLCPARIVYVRIEPYQRLNRLKQKIKHFFMKLRSGLRKSLDNYEEQLLLAINNYLTANSLMTGDLKSTTVKILKKFQWKFDQITVQGINDIKLVNFLQNIPENFGVFTGGGILRKPILGCGKKFIHVHPGVVPAVKGADCILWSALVRKMVGMSAFFMNEEIDTGDILCTKEYPLPKLIFNQSTIDTNKLKNVIINFLDPHYRADVLLKLFLEESNPAKWAIRKQNPLDGKTYYFMHQDISKIACDFFFQEIFTN